VKKNRAAGPELDILLGAGAQIIYQKELKLS